MSLKYIGFTRLNGPGCEHLIIALRKNAANFTLSATETQIDRFITKVGELVPGLSGNASAEEVRTKVKLLVDLAYHRAEGHTLGQIKNKELEAL